MDKVDFIVEKLGLYHSQGEVTIPSDEVTTYGLMDLIKVMNSSSSLGTRVTIHRDNFRLIKISE